MMTNVRLIDANALEAAITVDYYEHFTQCHDTDQIALIDMVRDDIGNAPTVDAVPVVRCKDCKYWTMGYCNHFAYYDYEPMTNEDDFCSYGERRTDHE